MAQYIQRENYLHPQVSAFRFTGIAVKRKKNKKESSPMAGAIGDDCIMGSNY